jgi:hypothetical protein
MKFSELIPILQGAVSPVILISGVGLLILSMTNRLGRVLDRSRSLIAKFRTAEKDEQKRLKSQLEILVYRSRILRRAISFAVMSALGAALLVIALFLAAVYHIDVVLLGVALFTVCLVSLILSLLTFLQDINRSLAALKLELSLLDE